MNFNCETGEHNWWNTSGSCAACGLARPAAGHQNPELTVELASRHDSIPRTLIRDPEYATPVITDNATGASVLRIDGEFFEVTGHPKVGAIRTEMGWAVLHHAVNSNNLALVGRVLAFNLAFVNLIWPLLIL